MYKKDIPKYELKKLYLEEKLTHQQIANHFGCGSKTIARYLRVYDLLTEEAKKQIRNKNRIIPEAELRKLYLEENFSQSKIAEQFGCSQTAVYRAMKKYGISTRNKSEINMIRYDSFRRDFDGDTLIKAYMLGFCKGDVHAWVRDKNSQTIRLVTSTTKDAQEKLFRGLFEDYGHFYVNRTGEIKIARMAAFVNFTFDFLLEEKDQIPDWVLEDEETFFSFFVGYTDAEGSIGVYNGYAVYKLDTGDKNIIFQSHAMLKKVGLVFADPTICGTKGMRSNGYPYNQDMWRLKTLAKNLLLTLFERISPYLRHEKRIKDMNKAIENVKQRNVRNQSKKG